MSYHPRTVTTTTTSSTFEPINEYWESGPVTTHSQSSSSYESSWSGDKIVNQPIHVRDFSGMVNEGTQIIRLQNLLDAHPHKKL